MTLCLYEAGKEQEFMCYDLSYFAVVYTPASAAQHFFTVIIFNSENIPSLSVEVVVSVSYDVLLMQLLYITAGPPRGLLGAQGNCKKWGPYYRLCEGGLGHAPRKFLRFYMHALKCSGGF